MIHPCFILTVEERKTDSGLHGKLFLEQESHGSTDRKEIGWVDGLTLRDLESVFKHEGAGYQTCFFVEVKE